MTGSGWRLPLDEEYDEQLKSNFADMANIGAPGTPARSLQRCFLARFTKRAALGRTSTSPARPGKAGAAKGATGRPVPLLTKFLLERAG